MKLTAVYDNGGKTLDRYTFVTDQAEWANDGNNELQAYMSLGTDINGVGFSQFSAAMPGRHLGKRVQFTDISADLQQHVAMRLWGES